MVAISCISHSSWNLIAKRNVQQGDFFWWSLFCVMSALLLPVMIGLWWMPLPFACWVLGVKSGAFIGLYFASLSMAYRLGDMSIIYPLARSAPLFLLTWTAIVMGVRFDVYGYIGVGLVGLGAVVLPMFTGLGWRRWFNMANLWAMVTALATTGYSLCDHATMNIIEKNYAGTFDHVARSVCYLWIQFSFGWVVLSLLTQFTTSKNMFRIIRFLAVVLTDNCG